MQSVFILLSAVSAHADDGEEISATPAGNTRIWGQLQTWATVWDQDVDQVADPATYGDPEADPGFTVARARLGFAGVLDLRQGTGASQVDYGLSVGMAAPYDVLSVIDDDVQIVDGFGRWSLPSALGTTSLSMGVQRVPFSRDAMTSSMDLVFQERAVSTAWLAPPREAGAIAAQSISFSDEPDGAHLLVQLGAFNGNGDIFGDTDPGILEGGRLEFGLGETYRTWSPELEPALGIGVAGTLNAEVATTTNAFQADLLGRFSVVTLQGEVVSSSIQPTATDVSEPGVLGPIHRFGWFGQLSVWIPVDGEHGVEVAGRYASFDDNADLDNAGDVGLLHAGATWRNPLPMIDVGVGFIHRTETTEITNDTIRIWTQVRPEGRF